MPTYSFMNKKTKKEYEMIMSMSEREQYLKDNPDVIQTITSAPAAGDPNKVGSKTKPSESFRKLLGRIKKNHPDSSIDTF